MYFLQILGVFNKIARAYGMYTFRPGLGQPSFLHGCRVSFPGLRQPRHQVNHSPPSSAEVKNEWSYTSTPPLCFYSTDREKFTFVRGIYVRTCDDNELKFREIGRKGMKLIHLAQDGE
jgi:hypothetical protein